MRNYLVYSGTIGWEPDSFPSGFYPEDLPEDWRLSFYNTQFRCVYLPFHVWHKATAEMVNTWLNECDAEFCFVLGLPEAGNTGIDERVKQFGRRGRLEDRANLAWVTSQTSLRELASRIAEAAKNHQELFIIAPWGQLTQLRQVSELMAVMGV